LYEIVFTKLKQNKVKKNIYLGTCVASCLLPILSAPDFLAFLHSDSIYHQE